MTADNSIPMEAFMKIIGIIAEYNPFHNGHAYQIAKVRELTGADYVVAAMSGDFIQRGEPAILDKYARAAMALHGGVDLVLELPALWACSSAEHFAMAGVTLLEKMGCVDGICFGAETDNLPLLSLLADILAEEPQSYREALSSYLKSGMNFPTARAKAFQKFFKNSDFPANRADEASPTLLDSTEETPDALLRTPNNILAIEYLKALKRRRSSIKPILLKRQGAGYHDTLPFGGAASPASFASATGIRNLLLQTPVDALSRQDAASPSATAVPPTILPSLQAAMPASALSILQSYLSKSPLLTADDFSSILGYRLLSSDKTALEEVYDMTPEMANRLYKNRYRFQSFSQFCAENKRLDITYSRMSRTLLHLMLDMTASFYDSGKQLDYIPYLRMLGFRKDSAPLLSAIKKNAAVPVISKLADASNLLSAGAASLLEKDLFAADLYEQRKTGKTKHGFSCSEYQKNLIVLSINDGTGGFR